MDFTLSDARAHLGRAPDVLRALVGPLDEPWLSNDEGPGTWSPIQVVRHLIWCEVDDWIPRARMVLEHGESQAFNQFDREGGESRYGHLAVPALLDEFCRLRAENLRTLDGFSLDPSKLALPGRHPALGAVTLGQLLATWVAPPERLRGWPHRGQQRVGPALESCQPVRRRQPAGRDAEPPFNGASRAVGTSSLTVRCGGRGVRDEVRHYLVHEA